MATVTLADMEHKLLSIEEITQQLQKTEPLTDERIDNESKVRFRFTPDWAHGIESVAGTAPVDVTMTINGTDRQMTKEAVLQAGANFGLPGAYMRKIPANFAEGLLNHHYSTGMGSEAFKVLSVADRISAFTRPTLVPFSNIQLLNSVVEGIQEIHGANTPIYADYKYANSLLRTDIRLIVPEAERVMDDTNMDDIPEGSWDTWLAGIHLSNSLIGKTQTSEEAFMFRWWCTNGCTTTLDSLGSWSRRRDGQEEDVYEWARTSVNEILGGMEHMFDQVQALTQLNVTGNTPDVLREIFAQYEVPVSQRESIMTRLVGMGEITMYHIMQAITEVANESDMEDRRRDRLMRIGGALPTTTFDTLKARVWREGHAADAEQLNPYEPLVMIAS